MSYYYRSHETTHIRTRHKIIGWMKRAKYAFFGMLLLFLSAGYYMVQKDGAPLMETAYISDDAAKTYVGDKPGKNFSGGKEEIPVEPDAGVLNLADLDPWDLRLGDHLTEKVIRIAPGDTLINILQKSGLATSESFRVVNILKEVFDPRNLRQGQALHLMFEDDTEDFEPVFQGLRLELAVGREVQLINCTDLGLMAREYNITLETRPTTAMVEINSSLYQGAVDAGLPLDILMQVIRAYSFDVDFQRDIRPGDRVEVLYEEKINTEGDFIKTGAVLFASLDTRGRSLPIYRYETLDGETDFFDADGKSVRKTLMVTPIDGARISSGYGMRRHPIQGFNRMHKGLDFAAPTGTPIMAAGNGVIEQAGRNGSYGHYIRIRHPNEYHTAYAHLSRYASGIRSGVRVRQGQVIGYVGSTGASTGPHLHYEVHHRGSHVNPATVKTPPGRTLEGDERNRFQVAKANLEKLHASLMEKTGLVHAQKKPEEKSGESSESG